VGEVWKRLRGVLLRLYERRLYPESAVEALRQRSALLELFAVMLTAVRGKGRAEPPPSVSPEFEATLARLQTPPFAFPGLDALAEVNRMNRRSFTNHFRAMTGVSPRAFQQSARLNHAERLLARHTASVKETATTCGYSNSQNFIRAFRRYFETSPGRMRRRG
jgi:AraC-like DNA-binding protein